MQHGPDPIQRTKITLQGWEELEEKSKRLAEEVKQLEAEVMIPPG